MTHRAPKPPHLLGHLELIIQSIAKKNHSAGAFAAVKRGYSVHIVCAAPATAGFFPSHPDELTLFLTQLEESL